MAPHAKYIAVFETQFWREQGLSGEAQSTVGPMAEIHDASTEDGQAALFGFFGIPAVVRAQVTESELKALCRKQLVRLFGQEAAVPVVEYVKDWANDSRTATEADQQPGLHQTDFPSSSLSGVWQRHLTGIGSEWSPDFPGYLAGAVDAAQRGVEALLP
jgi:monoamine oxidase